jgi:hypothetical protein
MHKMDRIRTKLDTNLLLAGGSLPLVALSRKLAEKKAEKLAKKDDKAAHGAHPAGAKAAA